MIKETGRVVAIDDEFLWVETIQRSSCHSCAAKSGCGQSVLGKMFDGRRSHIRLSRQTSDTANYQVDDQVEIGLPEDALLKGATWVYLMPLFGLIGGGVLFSYLFNTPSNNSDAIAILGSVLGFAISLIISRFVLSRGYLAQSCHPVLMGKAPKEDAAQMAQPVQWVEQ